MVDAGMRQLYETGWMHNRVRMIVASFLVKHLLLSWNDGARWFWDTLVDADLASNTQGWQWAAGCGADAAPISGFLTRSAKAKNLIVAGNMRSDGFLNLNPCPPSGPSDPGKHLLRYWKLTEWIWEATTLSLVLITLKAEPGHSLPWPL